MDQTEAASKEFWLDALRADGAAFRTAAGELDLTRPVPSCPEWTVRDLVGHLGVIYAFVRSIIEAGGVRPPRPDPPGEGSDVLAWFDGQFAAVLAVLAAADPGAPAYNWSNHPQVAGFWPRRMAQETAVHRWDAQMAGGVPDPIPAELAADGVSEVLDTFLPTGRGPTGNGAEGLVRLAATDLDRTWLVRLRPTGVTLLDESGLLDDPAHGQTGVGGTASDLLLALWGRLTPSALAIEGDPARFLALRTG
jgi:uncharacterized protein (TIGR03083 family)